MHEPDGDKRTKANLNKKIILRFLINDCVHIQSPTYSLKKKAGANIQLLKPSSPYSSYQSTMVLLVLR
jgi:hypothetical protein